MTNFKFFIFSMFLLSIAMSLYAIALRLAQVVTLMGGPTGPMSVLR